MVKEKFVRKKTHHKLGKLYEMLLPPLDMAPSVRYGIEGAPADNKFVKFFRTMFNMEKVKLIVSPRIVENAFVIKNTSNLPKGSKILDFGCAESILALQLACMGYKVTGVDIQDYVLRHSNLEFIKGDFLKIGFKRKFDCVTVVSSVEHVGLGFYGDEMDMNGDLKTMEKIRKILKPQGILIITIPFGCFSSSWERSYDEKGLKGLLKRFRIIHSEYYVKYQDTWIEVNKEDLKREDESVFCAVCKVKE